MRWAEHVARMGERRIVCRILVGKPEGKSSLGRPRRKWVDNIKMDIEELGTAVMQWFRGCVTKRKVAGSIPAGVRGIFH